MYSLEELNSVALEVMSGLGYEGNPVAVYGHNDTQHNHVHIITTRINASGKKVPHHFEGRRANELVQQLLQTDKRALFDADLDYALSYRFSSPAQLRLLMEQKGYESKENKQMIHFYKYGALQGQLPVSEIRKTQKTAIASALRMRAIIHKYKCNYSTTPLQDEKEKYSTQKKQFKTELTEYLNKRFGWQFLFFRNSGHDQPYGYVIIDHHKKVVYKGSDIIPVVKLLSPLNMTREVRAGDEAKETRAIKNTNTDATDNTKLEERVSTGKADTPNPVKSIDRLIGQAEWDAEQEQKTAYDPKRRKGRFI